MPTYSYETKLGIVGEYLEGENLQSLIKKYHIKRASTALTWVKKYKQLGVIGLQPHVGNQRKYTVEFKQRVLKWKSENKATSVDTAKHFHGVGESSIRKWEAQLKRDGIAGLGQLKGRAATKPKKKPSKKRNQSELERLRQENLDLRMENEFLKKVRALNQKKRN